MPEDPKVKVISGEDLAELKNTKVPNLSEKMVEALERLFPNKCPKLELTDREVWFKAGQASVAEFLRAEYKRQLEEHEV